ncbi:MAG: carboxynorspermidine decarboxylase [Faecalimonas umbilicata]|uniref:carboxynorspermidine decarboxylase n=1 Tax=Faecalimonas umbilicata TaxID=1912855 RepID=UPI002431DAD2|nr:carboxynorspermidine decarboxylase [Faecalimonas umbilicata]MCI5986231.1 carboxynorspermidine decarboxylase [Faecalimonas umbilicata]MDY5094299.1 carboxynorspermidine decarboxylase [Faecalimonas umbilicata]
MSSMGKEVVSTPYFVVDERRLLHNLEILKQVAEESGCKILLAQKAFSMFSVYPLLRKYLCGTTASGLYEARLGKEEFGGETHVFSPAYRAEEFDELLQYVDDLVFNSPAQVRKYGIRAKNAGKSIGLRVNPECSTQEGHVIYDPCAPGSRLGTTLEAFEEELVPLLDGIHMHTLCEQNSDDLEKTVEALEDKFGKWLPQMKWLNLGGGHHITRVDYDRERLVRIIRRLREKYQLEVYLEPGEAVVLNAGDLVASVMEIVHNNMEIAILDTSAACHMPDVLEMPYRPPVQKSGNPGEKQYTYRFAGPTCLAGDVIGDYSFEKPLTEGSRVVFEDMALYTMVKTNTFNGMALPSIVFRDQEGEEHLVRTFGYEDFKNRLS